MSEINPGTLYLVPTPIGNLEDITERAVEILKQADIIAAEDTRHTRILLDHLGIAGHVVSYHEHNKKEAGPKLIEKLLDGQSVAQVSDAGMPVISDPGADLVRLALAEDLPIVPLPGPNAALTALVASGLDARQFAFIGFLPKITAKQKKLLIDMSRVPVTLIFYEAPHRLKELRAELDEKDPRGEYVILVEGWNEDMAEGEEEEASWEAEALELAKTLPQKEAARKIAAKFHMGRRDVYQYLLKNGD